MMSVSKTDGHYVYPIDDAYTHLAMAKNFALYEMWGVTRYEFSSTSSSPLFTGFLSFLIKIFGNNDQIPLYVNLIFGAGTVYILNLYFSRIFESPGSVVLSVLFTLFISVLHLQVLSGMEHVLHVFLLALNIFCLTRPEDKRAVSGFYLSLLLMGMVRFESMFYFAVLAFVFVLLKQWKKAASVLLTGFIPIAAFCCINYQQDGYLFPNSVMVKGTKLAFDGHFPQQLKQIFLDNFLLNTSFYKIGFFPVLICLVLIFRAIKGKNFQRVVQDHFLLIVISLVMICHSMFADLKGLFRYEAYLLTGFSMVIIPEVKGCLEDPGSYLKKEKVLSVFILMNVVLMFYKFFSAHRMLSEGGKNIYEQQIQSAKFLHTYYNESKVVANDIGAVTYFTDIHLLDTAGLASVETIPFNENKRKPDAEFEYFLTRYTADRNYDIAVIYDAWLQPYIPKNWKKAAVLKIKNPVTVSRDEVSIYSINHTSGHELQENIRKFKWNRNVQVTLMDEL
ncbi:hypothetical protein CHA01nite_07570 [Chryseobacterium hagamense]|uniref:Uncharacterized protein n=2 Tax=Chryseobacterium hagamense TaxID=395935 RepID=A0A511YII8_9FLAO|nr:hypothetical protein CHA01nite_07570 [Chryseobacterium hagamense]